MSDETRSVRPGEELPAAELAGFLARELGLAGSLEVRQFPGGHSNLTYAIRMGGRELVLRRPPVGSKVKTAHDMGREYRVLSKLAPVWSLAPRPVAMCEDLAVMGVPFYLMDRMIGVVFRRDPPPGVAADASTCGRLCQALVAALVDLHAIDAAAIGLGDFGNPEGYLERQVTGWAKRYQGSQTDDMPDMDAVARYLAANLPRSGAATIVHGDYKHDNVVVDPADPARIVGILDWEMSTLGDPLADLGTTLSYWVEAGDPPSVREYRFGPTSLPGSWTRAEIAARYGELSGRDTSHVVYYYVLGLFKGAVIGQQIYYRYRQGLTQDARFARLGELVGLTAARAAQAIDTGKL
jgi:aminoglycoside phosphotransferase (APT) family kinase protein